MRKFNKIRIQLSILASLVSTGFGLEFGSMGQASISMGGAGVALKNSAWGLYYNPALLGADRRSKFGYSFGAQIKEQNLLQLATIDIDNLKNLPQTLTDEITGPTGGSNTKITISANQVSGALGNMLNELFPGNNGTISKTEVENLVKDITGSTTLTNCTNISSCWDNVKDTDAQKKLQDKLLSAAEASGSSLIASIVSGINIDKLVELAKEATNGNFDANKLLQNIGTITITKGSNPAVDRFLEDFSSINKSLKRNELNLTSQNGFVIQIAGGKEGSSRGALGVGLFASAFVNGSALIDPRNNKLIFELGGKYYNVETKKEKVSLTLDSNRNDLNGSIMNSNANHKIYTNTLTLMEVPVGYGHTLLTAIGDLNVGVAAKFIQAVGYGHNFNFSVGKIPDINFNKDDLDITQTFGIDFGVLYTPSFLKSFNVGLVAKNLNAPIIQRSNGIPNIVLNRQVRAGLSYSIKNFLTFAFDADLMPNNTLSLQSPESQFIGGGVMANFKILDIRFGAMKDKLSKAHEGLILTGGVNLLGFLDVAVQYGLGKSITINDINVPSYMNIHVGGQFTF